MNLREEIQNKEDEYLMFKEMLVNKLKFNEMDEGILTRVIDEIYRIGECAGRYKNELYKGE